MSAVFKIAYEGQDFDIEITRDGELFFLDYDLELDLIREELGEKPTPAVRLWDEWNEKPIYIIITFLKMSYHDLIYLAADFAAHVLPLYRPIHKDDHGQSLRDAIKAAVDFVDGKINHRELEKHKAAAWNTWQDSGWKDVARAAWNVAMAAWTSLDMREVDDLTEWAAIETGRISLTAARAVAWFESSDRSSPQWQHARDLEMRWQLRRFVDCMEAIQAGKDWPDLKDTK